MLAEYEIDDWPVDKRIALDGGEHFDTEIKEGPLERWICLYLDWMAYANSMVTMNSHLIGEIATWNSAGNGACIVQT